jgi:ribosomal protein L11 methyltransferase
VTAVDIDESSVKNAIHNAELNDVSDKYKAFQSNLTNKVTGKYDLVVANILADPIKNLIKNIKNYMNNDATLILSGIADFRAEEVAKTLNKDFNIVKRKDKDHWTCLVVKLKNE